MRNLKKFLALVLAMMMALSLMVTANAQNAKKEYQDVADAEFTEAIDVLTGMGVFKGSDGDFRPTETITRAEAAAVLYRLVTGDVEDKQVELYAPQAYQFSDVTPGAWYAGYVGFAVDAGFVKGYNGEFMPSKKVTGYEMLAMLLRAVGYGKNGEFTGDAWRINVGATAQQLGILKPIESTHYGNTLSHDSAREVVAELTFVTATEVSTVTWTQLGGYNEYATILQDKGKNPTLGEKVFGLTDTTGIIVGNQATDEGKTLVALTGNTIEYKESAKGDDAKYEVPAKYAYAYPGTEIEEVEDVKEGFGNGKKDKDGDILVTEALSLDIKTGLDLFGHKVTAWHNGKGHAYAVIDEAKVETVFAKDEEWVDGKELYKAGTGAGFDSAVPAYKSDRFGRIVKVEADKKAAASKVGMYRLIDNNGDGKVDVVISLNQEVAQITQRNSTVKDGEYIFIGKGDSQFGDKLGDKPGKLLDSKLAPNSDKTLGHVVTVNEIVGTGTVKDEDDKERARENKDYLYEVKELKAAFTGTISTYKLDGDDVIKVTLTNGDSYDLSGITGADAPYKTDTDDDDAGIPHLLGGVTKLDKNSISAGKTYSFYTDELDRFIGVYSANEYKFLYTTFADYEIGALGTGTAGYYAYGVDWNGNVVSTNNQIKSITLPVAEGDDETPDKFDEAQKADCTDYSGGTLADGYNLLPVTMKDQGTSVGGNRIKGGSNTRFVLNGEGHLSWLSEGCSEYGERFTSWFDKPAEGDGEASFTWKITAQDAKNGFVRVYNDKEQDSATAAADGDNVDYLLTSETKFIVVTGSGTADLSVKICDGLTGLLDGATTAEISSGFGVNKKDEFGQYGDNVYFLTDDTQYGNVDTSKNRTITTVILSDGNLFRYSTENLYFAAPGAKETGVHLAGTNPDEIKQFELYNNGKPAYYWIDVTKSDEGAAGDVDDKGKAYEEDPAEEEFGEFYTLAQIGTESGQPVYKASRVTTTKGNNLVGGAYKYITVNNVNTAEIGGTVYKVGGATVAEAYGTNAKLKKDDKLTLIDTNEIDTVEKLNHAISMGTATVSGELYDVTVAIVYDGINVSCIYVTNIVDHVAG